LVIDVRLVSFVMMWASEQAPIEAAAQKINKPVTQAEPQDAQIDTTSHSRAPDVSSITTVEATRSGLSTTNPALPTLSPGTAVTPDDAPSDPYFLERLKRSESGLERKRLRHDYPNGKPKLLKKYYERQNELIDAFLGGADEEHAQEVDMGR
jgi:hypothetical protein